MRTRTEEVLDELQERLEAIGGCSDGYCLVTGPAKGMHTNGGCRCLDYDKYKAKRVVSTYQAAISALRKPDRIQIAPSAAPARSGETGERP